MIECVSLGRASHWPLSWWLLGNYLRPDFSPELNSPLLSSNSPTIHHRNSLGRKHPSLTRGPSSNFTPQPTANMATNPGGAPLDRETGYAIRVKASYTPSHRLQKKLALTITQGEDGWAFASSRTDEDWITCEIGMGKEEDQKVGKIEHLFPFLFYPKYFVVIHTSQAGCT